MLRKLADQNQFRDKLASTSRYRRLLDLRKEVQGSRGRMPFSIYSDIENRIDEKIRNFDYPSCDKVRITIMFSNGLAMELDSDECVSAMKSDMRLSSYIFSKYPSAVDFNLENDEFSGTYAKTAEKENEDDRAMSSPLHERLSNGDMQIKVDLLIHKVDKLEKMYNDTIPRISKGIDELKSKMDYLYKKLIEK